MLPTKSSSEYKSNSEPDLSYPENFFTSTNDQALYHPPDCCEIESHSFIQNNNI